LDDRHLKTLDTDITSLSEYAEQKIVGLCRPATADKDSALLKNISQMYTYFVVSQISSYRSANLLRPIYLPKIEAKEQQLLNPHPRLDQT
jgi:hypothetical protein